MAKMGSLASLENYDDPQEAVFQAGIRATPWFDEYQRKYGETPDLETPDYNYREAWKAGARPVVRDPGDRLLHWPSQFKGDSHPNRYVGGVDTKTGDVVAPPSTMHGFEPPQYDEPPPPLAAVPPDLSRFAMGALAAQNAYQPFVGSRATGTTPWKKMDIEALNRDAPRDPIGGDPATTKWLATQMGDLLTPTTPLDYATLAAGPIGKIAGKAAKMGTLAAGFYGQAGVDEAEAAKWTKYPFNNIGVGDTLSNLAKLNKHVPTKDIVEKTIQPHDIPVGSWLTPLIGDRSRSGELVTHIGEKALRDPVQMQGGYQFMPEWKDAGVAWASDRSPISTIAGRVNKFPGREGTEVFGVYSPMSPQSIDASHHVSDAVSQLMHVEKKNISKTAIEKFDAKAEELIPDFPGVASKGLQSFMRDQTMTNRNKFVKLMNSRSAREEGFPDVEQARLALTHPDLIDTPSYAGGQSIASLTGTTSHGPRSGGVAPHHTYASKLHGQYTGGLPGALPPELLWRDLLPKIAARDPSAAGKIWLTGLKGEHFGQRVDPQWQDAAAEYYRRNPRGE